MSRKPLRKIIKNSRKLHNYSITNQQKQENINVGKYAFLVVQADNKLS